MRLAPVLGLVVPIVASSCLAASPALAEWTEWIAEADASFAFDSNLNNASIDAEEEWDLFWRPEARLGRVFQLEGSTRLHLLATLRGEIHHRWQNLDSIAGAGELALSHKFGLGDAPWARVFANGGYEGVQDGQRSGLRAEVGAQAGKRFSPRLDAAIAYRFLVRQGDDGRMVMVPTDTDVWDQEAHELGIEGRWLATGRLLVTAGYDFRSGDLYSNAQSDLPTLLFAAETHAAAQDLVFGGWAYRIEGHAHSPYLSLNWALGDHWSVDAGYRFRYAESRALDYTNHVARLTLLFRY